MSETTRISVKLRWQTARFWQKLFIYFWVFSLIGHYLEIFIAELYHIATGNPAWQPIILTIIPLAAPYGLGIAAIIFFVIPLIKRFNLQPIVVLALCMIAASIVEYGSALFVTMIDGHNQYWNYINLPYNLNGWVSLRTSLGFGLLSVVFIYVIYPLCEKQFSSAKDKQISILFWVLFVIYCLDLIFTYLVEPCMATH